MLTTASQFTSRARSLHVQNAATVRILGGGCPQGIRPRQQSRGFRWGFWSNLDDELSEQIRQRHRLLKQKYSEQINRRLSWDKHPLGEDPRHALKRIMKTYWHSSYSGDRFCDEARPTKHPTPDNEAGVRTGHTIEDVERGAMDQLIFGEDPATPHPSWNRNPQRLRARHLKWTSQTSCGQPIEEDKFIIDPITNRKVTKQPPATSLKNGENSPVKSFKDYRSLFVHPDTASKQADPPEQRDEDSQRRPQAVMDAHRYYQSDGNVQPHDASTGKHSQPAVSKVGEYSPAVLPERHNSDSSLKDGARLEDLLGYKPFTESRLADNFNLATNMEGISQNHADNIRHKASMEEAYGKFCDLQPPQETIDEYGYKSVVADRIASRVADVKSRGANQNNSATGETDTMIKVKPAHDVRHQRSSIRHEGKPLGFREEYVKPEVLREYRSSIQTVKPEDFSASTVEELRAKYGAAEVKQYTTSRHLKPVDSLSQQYDGSSEFKELVTRNEPHDEHSSFPKRPKEQCHPEHVSKCGALNRRPQPSPEVLSQSHSDLHRYDEPSFFEEKTSFDNNQVKVEDCHESSLTPNDSDGKPSSLEEELAHPKTPGTLHELIYQESDGRPETLERLVSVKQGYGRKLSSARCKASEHLGSPRPILERLASVRQGQGKVSNYREMLESLMNQHEQLSNEHDAEATLAVESAKAKNQQADGPSRKLTGNYVRDFPEEFEKSWTQTLASTPDTTDFSSETEVLGESEAMDGGLEGAFGRPTPSRLQPALDRHFSAKAAINQDASKKEKLEGFGDSRSDEGGERLPEKSTTSEAKEELVTTTKEEPTVAADQEAKKYAVDEASEILKETRISSENEPVLYKILAYDPTMQKINMAETTSLVPDFASALSPADALLRLSHPTRFFPHFAGLETEGFEIASGSGDVLVFRKVRPAKSEQVEETKSSANTAAAATKPPPSPTESPVNPIDMTGRPRMVAPASANFASPTGYVKYENLPETEASNLPPPPPRIAYNINLRREEPVYSGPKYKVYDEQKRKKNLGQRVLVGGVWVACISYGVGVVSEYFTTGGVDGMGPQGL